MYLNAKGDKMSRFGNRKIQTPGHDWRKDYGGDPRKKVHNPPQPSQPKTGIRHGSYAGGRRGRYAQMLEEAGNVSIKKKKKKGG